MINQRQPSESIQWDRPILIGGCPSTGSTLLSVMLDAHPSILCGPELTLFAHRFFWNQSGEEWRRSLLYFLERGYLSTGEPQWTLGNGFCPYAGPLQFDSLPWYGWSKAAFLDAVRNSSCAGEVIRQFYAPVLQSHGKRIWAEKSPPNLYAFQEFLDCYPQGRVICLVRDARDVVCSLMRRQGGSFKKAVSTWLVETAICEAYRQHPRVLFIRYEDLVLDARNTIQRILTSLGLTLEVDRLLRFYEHSSRIGSDPSIARIDAWRANPGQPVSSKSVGAWQTDLTPEQLAAMAAAVIVEPVEHYPGITGQSVDRLLQAFGYEPIRIPGVQPAALLTLINREKLFLCGDDYEGESVFHEGFVECDPNRLPPCERSWSEQRLLQKLSRLRTVFDLKHHELEAKHRQLKEELGEVKAWRARVYSDPIVRVVLGTHRLLRRLLRNGAH